MTVQDYKSTLNLPNTSFPMKANLPIREPEILEFWQKISLYTKTQQAAEGKQTFILNDGPPYANGSIHIGHALNKILKDMAVKANILSGKKAPVIPGWDCHGLPIEHQIEKKVGKPGHKISQADFRQNCREFAAKQVELQKQDFKRLGVLADWDNPYVTMNAKFEADVVRALAKIVENGHIVKGERPVHWCMDCNSALAEAEVEYRNKISPSIDVCFSAAEPDAVAAKFIGQSGSGGEGPVYVVIWTTTPWTLPGNQAIAIAENEDYALLQRTGLNGPERLIVADQLVDTVMKRAGIDHYQKLGYCKGCDLEYLMCKHPFYDLEVPIILADHVTLDAGTGCVHTAPAHGNEDYIAGLKYNLPIVNKVAGNGCFTEDTEYLAGQHVFKANTIVIDILKKANKLLSESKVEHSYPHCWRHKTPLIFRATPQWFISMDKAGLRDRALAAIKQVTWYPEWGEARISKMIHARPDWCISRQRTWGTPMAFIVHKKTGELHPDMPNIMRKIADKFDTDGGLEAWYSLELEEIIGTDAKNYTKVSDTLDVWFESGVVHYCVLNEHFGLSFPADLYLEGSDQHRGWFHTSLLTSIAMNGVAPFRSVLTHGYTVDGDGKKMSKSLGNVLKPDKLLKTLGADIVRMWVASVDYQKEINVSDEILKRSSDAYRRIRNTARFLLANMVEFNPKQHLVPLESMVDLDRWVVSKAHKLQQEIIEAYLGYNFHAIYQKIHNFCIVFLGGFYLDIIKDRQYTCKTDSDARRSAQTAIYHLTEYFVRWIAPIISFTAEEIWRNMPGKREDSVFLAGWYALDLTNAKEQIADSNWNKLIDLRTDVNKAIEKARSDGNIGSSLEAEITLYLQPDLLELLTHLDDEARFVFIVSKLKLQPLDAKPANADVTDSGQVITVAASKHQKCERCWHRCASVNSNANYPGICSRCVLNIAGKGEVRAFA